MAVFVTAPLAAPGGITATVLAGGTLLANTTYYYRICAQNSVLDYFRSPAVLYGAWSVEGSFVTTGTDRSVRFDWLAVPSAIAYTVFLSTTSGVYTGTVKCGSTILYTTVGNVLTYTLTAPPTVAGSAYWLGVSAVSFPKPARLAVDQGNIIVDMSGGETLESIYAAIVAAGYAAYVWFDGSTFILDGSINITNRATTNSLYLYGYNITLLSGYANAAASGINVYIGRQPASGRWFRPTTLRLLSVASVGSGGWSSNTKLYGAVILGGYLNVMSGGLSGDYRAGVSSSDFPIMQDARCLEGFAFTAGIGAYVYRHMTASLLMPQNGKITSADCVVNSATDGTFMYTQSGSSCDHYRTHCLTFPSCEAYLADNCPGKLMRAYDCLLDSRKDNVPVVLWRQISTGVDFPTVEVYYSLSLKVVDSAGAIIAGATVTITDVFGTVIGTYTTTADGQVFADTATLTTATASVLTDTAKAWTVNEHRGKEVYIASGVAAGLVGVVLSNTATALTLHDALSPAPAIGDRIGFASGVKAVELRHKDGSGQGSGAAYTTRTDYGPFTVTVSKAGYRTSVTKGVISAKTAWVVALEANLGHAAVM